MGIKFSISLAFIGWTCESLDLEIKSPSISPSSAGLILSLKQPLDSESKLLPKPKFPIHLAFIGWAYDIFLA
jgi:hypothetical protein